MKRLMQYANKPILVLVWILLFTKIGIASNCPIIFLHGHECDPTDTTGWKTWRNPQSAMKRILNNQYGGYTAGEPLECNENTVLTSTGGETRKIYSFSYYCHDGDSGAIGSNGILRCSKVKDRRDGRWYPRESVPPQFAVDLYAGVVNNNSWAEKLAHFINKVIAATGASQVDIVAYSMGGLVARAAIKYYGSAAKVRKLLMIGTPNHPYQHSFGEWIYDMFTHDKHWQKYGEDFEMDVDMATGEHGINFETSDPTSDAPWCDHLGYENQGVQIATIAGNRGHGWPITIENDKVVAVSQVKMGSSAEFEPTIYASHSYDGEPEVALTACTYTEEFIKNWMIDDNTTHVGGVPFGTFQVYDTIPFDDDWDTYELRLREPVDNYYKTLTALVECWTYLGSFANKIHLGYRAFPLYRYSRGCPGDPIFATNPAEYPSSSIFPLYFYTRVYDMNGLVSEGTDALWLRPTNLPEKCNVEIVKPVANEVYTVQSTLDKLDIKFEADFYKAQILTVWFSWGANMPFLQVWSATNFDGGGVKTVSIAIPQVNSPYCRVSVTVQLDNVILPLEIADVSDYFTIRLDAPYDLYAFAVDESKVGLDWRCGTLLNFEVWRMKSGESWQMIAQGYWGPGSKSFYDETVERNTTYYYKVRSYGIFQGQKFYSDFCAPISVTTPLLNAPYHELRVHSPASDRIIVQFQDKSNYETNFEVWRRCPPTGEPWHIETTLPAEPSSGNWVTWIDYNVKPESTYLYRVRAYTSTPPAGHSAYTLVYGATVAPHLKTSRDSATAYQPKVLYDHDNYLYYMAYGLESLLVASRSTDGLSWEGPITACYWGQEMYEKDAGFCQLDLKENGLPVMVFSYRNRKTFPPNPLWWSSIHFAYFDPDSSDWIDSVCLYRGIFIKMKHRHFIPLPLR